MTVSVDDQPCNMFFDTGAPGIILNSRYFEHNIDDEVMGTGGHGAVGTGAVSGLHHVKSMDMSGLALHETDIMTSDLSNLEAVGIAVHGILGTVTKLFFHFVVLLYSSIRHESLTSRYLSH